MDMFYRTEIKIVTDDNREIWFDVISHLGADIVQYVELWSQYTDDINQDGFCEFMQKYGFEVYPYFGQDINNLKSPMECESHEYDNFDGTLRCKKCGEQL